MNYYYYYYYKLNGNNKLDIKYVFELLLLIINMKVLPVCVLPVG
jgi:hypothetical protein